MNCNCPVKQHSLLKQYKGLVTTTVTWWLGLFFREYYGKYRNQVARWTVSGFSHVGGLLKGCQKKWIPAAKHSLLTAPKMCVLYPIIAKLHLQRGLKKAGYQLDKVIRDNTQNSLHDRYDLNFQAVQLGSWKSRKDTHTQKPAKPRVCFFGFSGIGTNKMHHINCLLEVRYCSRTLLLLINKHIIKWSLSNNLRCFSHGK